MIDLERFRVQRRDRAGELSPDITGYTVTRATGNPCITGPDYDQAGAKHMVATLLAGCRRRA